jgi:hypothetical protein
VEHGLILSDERGKDLAFATFQTPFVDMPFHKWQKIGIDIASVSKAIDNHWECASWAMYIK